MDTPREFDNSTCFFSSVDAEQCVFNTHRPIANQIRIQIVPSVDRPLEADLMVPPLWLSRDNCYISEKVTSIVL